MSEPQNPTPPAGNPTPAPAPAPKPPVPEPKPPTPAPVKAGGDFQKVDVVFNDKSIVKLDVPHDVNLDKAWHKFQEDHSEVSDKIGAFPTSFVGDLVNKYGATQVDSKSEGYTKKTFVIG